MDNITINVVNIIGDVYGIEASDGEKVFELIIKAFKENKKVTLSFQNIKILTTAFLNAAVGQLYRDFDEEFIKQHLQVSEISESGEVALKRVIETAKLFYENPDLLKKTIDEISED